MKRLIFIIVLVIMTTGCSKIKLDAPYKYDLSKKEITTKYYQLKELIDFKIDKNKMTSVKVDDYVEDDKYIYFNVYLKEKINIDVLVDNVLLKSIKTVKEETSFINSYKLAKVKKPFIIEVKYFDSIKIEVTG